ncbi:hypothetical protein D3C77_508420 [compost metagenome]
MTQPGGGQYLRIAHVDGVGVAAIGVYHQCAVATGQRLAEHAMGAGAGFSTGTNGADAQLVAAVDIAVIGQDITGALRRCGLVAGDVAVVAGKRTVVGALNEDIEPRLRLGPGSVVHAVSKHFTQGFTCRAQGLHDWIVVVQNVLVAAVGIEQQVAVAPGDGLAGEGGVTGFTGHR